MVLRTNEMNILLRRTIFTEDSTIGTLYIDDHFFCYTIEDKDRGLKDSMSLIEIKARKIFGITAIPSGTYRVVLSMSNRFNRLMPEVLNVKGYEGIRIHRGNAATDSLGCPILGMRKGHNAVFESTIAETAFMQALKGATTPITLTITK